MTASTTPGALKPRRGTVRAKSRPYMRGEPAFHDIPATIVGDLAVHRRGYLEADGTVRMSDRYWRVTHAPTGETLGDRPLPIALRNCRRARDLIAWAAAIQEACPDFFAAAREGDRERMQALVGDLIDRGRAL